MPAETTALERIEKKLDVLILLIASGVGIDLPISERAPILHRAGLDRNSIAAVCNTSPESVSVRLTEAKKRRKDGR